MLNSFLCWPMAGESRERGQQLGFAKAGLLHVLAWCWWFGFIFLANTWKWPGLKVRFNMLLVSLVFL